MLKMLFLDFRPIDHEDFFVSSSDLTDYISRKSLRARPEATRVGGCFINEWMTELKIEQRDLNGGCKQHNFFGGFESLWSAPFPTTFRRQLHGSLDLPGGVNSMNNSMNYRVICLNSCLARILKIKIARSRKFVTRIVLGWVKLSWVPFDSSTFGLSIDDTFNSSSTLIESQEIKMSGDLMFRLILTLKLRGVENLKVFNW